MTRFSLVAAALIALGGAAPVSQASAATLELVFEDIAWDRSPLDGPPTTVTYRWADPTPRVGTGGVDDLVFFDEEDFVDAIWANAGSFLELSTGAPNINDDHFDAATPVIDGAMPWDLVNNQLASSRVVNYPRFIEVGPGGDPSAPFAPDKNLWSHLLNNLQPFLYPTPGVGRRTVNMRLISTTFNADADSFDTDPSVVPLPAGLPLLLAGLGGLALLRRAKKS